MKTDPVVEEVREARRKLAERFQFDIKKIFADAKSREATSGHLLIRCKTADCIAEEPGEEYKAKPENSESE